MQQRKRRRHAQRERRDPNRHLDREQSKQCGGGYRSVRVSSDRPDQIAERRDPQPGRQGAVDELDRVGIEHEVEPERPVGNELVERNVAEAGRGPHCRRVARHEQRAEGDVEENRAGPEPGGKTKRTSTRPRLRRSEHRRQDGRDCHARKRHVHRVAILSDVEAREVLDLHSGEADEPTHQAVAEHDQTKHDHARQREAESADA